MGCMIASKRGNWSRRGTRRGHQASSPVCLLLFYWADPSRRRRDDEDVRGAWLGRRARAPATDRSPLPAAISVATPAGTPGWIPPQVLRRKCLFSLPADIFEQPFNLVCVGSPTWWLQPAIPVTSLLRSESGLRLLNGRPFCVFAVARSFWRLNAWRVAALGKRCGGRHVGSRGFVFPGNQLQSFAALAGYLATGESPTRFWGMRVHPYGLTAAAVEAARAFASDLAEGSQDRPR